MKTKLTKKDRLKCDKCGKIVTVLYSNLHTIDFLCCSCYTKLYGDIILIDPQYDLLEEQVDKINSDSERTGD